MSDKHNIYILIYSLILKYILGGVLIGNKKINQIWEFFLCCLFARKMD